jgi:hypothetical protein
MPNDIVAPESASLEQARQQRPGGLAHKARAVVRAYKLLAEKLERTV